MAGHDQKVTCFIFRVHLTILKTLFAYLKYLNSLNFEGYFRGVPLKVALRNFVMLDPPLFGFEQLKTLKIWRTHLRRVPNRNTSIFCYVLFIFIAYTYFETIIDLAQMVQKFTILEGPFGGETPNVIFRL